MGWRNAAPPPVTTYGVSLLGRDQVFSIGRARYELGYQPEYDIAHGVAEGVKWYLTVKRGSGGTQNKHETVQVRR
jgi:nucleoside-diphosphate-sugar epimerase